MVLTVAALHELVARATPLLERIQEGEETERGEAHSNLVEKRLRAWRIAATGEDDRDSFVSRLAVLGIKESACWSCLEEGWLRDDPALPPWAITLQACLQRGSDWPQKGEGLPCYRTMEAIQPLPFEELFVSFIGHAREEMNNRLGESKAILGEVAWLSLENYLLKELTDQAALALSMEFRLFLLESDPLSLLELPPDTAASLSRDSYRDFVGNMLSGRFGRFLEEYAVLARLLGQIVLSWMEYVTEFCLNLVKDLPAIRAKFCGSVAPGVIARLRPGLSDPHHGRRTVIGLEFASGLQLIYKPKPVSLEREYYDLLAWLNVHRELLPFKLVQVLDCGTHGWVETVRPSPCETIEQGERYYQRAGMLLCLLYILQGSDFHSENVIACGEHPVLIDLETLMHPRARPWDDDGVEESADFVAGDAWGESVLRTGLLPEWESGKNGRSFDISGLGCDRDQLTGFSLPEWQGVNTDRMTLRYREGIARTRDNCPVWMARKLSVCEYESQIISGFAQMYQFLADHREELTAAAGPLSFLSAERVRYILRPTSMYRMLLDRLRHPEFLRDGADRGIELETLARIYLKPRKPGLSARLWPIYEQERQALERLEVPLFHTRGNADALFAGPHRVSEGFFFEPCFQRALSRLGLMNDQDREAQIGYIRAALHSRRVGSLGGPALPESSAPTELPWTGRFAEAELLAAATRIADQMRLSAIRGADGSANWMGVTGRPLLDKIKR